MKAEHDEVIAQLAELFKPQRYAYALAYREHEEFERHHLDPIGHKLVTKYEGGLEVRVLTRGTIANTKTVSWHARDFSFRYPDLNLEITAYPVDYCLAEPGSYSIRWFRKSTGAHCERCGHKHDLLRHALMNLDDIAERCEALAQALGSASLALETHHGISDDARTLLLYQATVKDLGGRIRLLHDGITSQASLDLS